MVAIDQVEKQVLSLVHKQPLVAVFVGGTAGIGQNTVRKLAQVHGAAGPGLRAYIVGRNAKAAADTIAVCRQSCPNCEFIFVNCQDLSLIQDVDKTCREIISLETKAASAQGTIPRVDMLYISSGTLAAGGRKETKEGLDFVMSLVYYSRMRVIDNLMPLLRSSTLPARVISVFGAGLEGSATFHTDDLSQRKPEHSGSRTTMTHVVRMTTLFAEALVKQDPSAPSIIHVYPGFVMTTVFEKSALPGFLKSLFLLLKPLLRRLAFTDDENGLRMLYLSTSNYPAKLETKQQKPSSLMMGSDGVPGSGVYAIDPQGEPIPTKKMDKSYKKLRSEGMAQKVYDHTMHAFREASQGRRFTA